MLAVYTAGYLRTQSAAQRFAGDAGGRRTRVQPETSAAEKVSPPAEVAHSPAAKDPPPLPIAAATTLMVTPPALEPPAPPVVGLPVPAPAPIAAAAIAPTPPVTVALAADAPASPAAPAIAAPVAATEEIKAPATLTATPAASAATPAVTATPSKWRDGKFSGWGSCRHGDIQATVEIKDGRILSAVVSKCHTVYSCDVISKVIPQVAERQSPDVDTVSGATQSADAFYWAVFSALADAAPEAPKAK